MRVGCVSNRFRTRAQTGRASRGASSSTVEDITGDVIPASATRSISGSNADDTRLAGLISFFGIEGSRGGRHPLGFAFDVTDIVQA